MNQPILPTSAVPWSTICAGSGGTLAALCAVWLLSLPPLAVMAIMLVACAAPMWLLEFRRHRNEPCVAASIDAKCRGTNIPSRTRLCGGALVVLMLLSSIMLQTRFGGQQIGGLPEITLPLLACLLAWLAWLSFRTVPAGPDSLATLATSVHRLLRTRRLDEASRQCLLGWTVKAFFLPLMLAWLYSWLAQLDNEIHTGEGWFSVFVIGMALLYALDTLFSTIGYLSTHRRIDAHIRSTDSTWLGWLSALVCYPPLSAVVLRQWLDYKDGTEWTHWLGDSWLAFVWGTAILLLTALYTSATLVFGPRFSNLTHRGIITAGPFRWTKHPAYISKNLSWWLIAVPFISTQGTGTAILHCLALLGVNGIYWLRAWSEERHLMRDPIYQQYAAWIENHGLLARGLRLLGLRKGGALRPRPE